MLGQVRIEKKILRSRVCQKLSSDLGAESLAALRGISNIFSCQFSLKLRLRKRFSASKDIKKACVRKIPQLGPKLTRFTPEHFLNTYHISPFPYSGFCINFTQTSCTLYVSVHLYRNRVLSTHRIDETTQRHSMLH